VKLIEDAIKSLELAVGAFEYQIGVCEEYANQGKIWGRIDANGVIAHLYAATNPVAEIRKTIEKLKAA
jgi:hypothetical protein